MATEVVVATKQACQLLGKPRATHYRWLKPKPVKPPRPRPAPANALSTAERAEVLAVLHATGGACAGSAMS